MSESDSVAAPAAPKARTRARRTPGQHAGSPAAQHSSHAVLEQLAGLYPHLFGAAFRPLKRGIFQDLVASHPELFEKDALKAALSAHTRSTRYLSVVAEGQQRVDLSGQAVEAMAPEHVHHALLEVYRRRQRRTPEDLRPKLCQRLVQAMDASGLSPQAYAERVQSKDEWSQAVLDEVMAFARSRLAREEALLRAYQSSGQDPQAFADMYGLNVAVVKAMLRRAGVNATAPDTSTR
jgi:sRNA-binding protein